MRKPVEIDFDRRPATFKLSIKISAGVADGSRRHCCCFIDQFTILPPLLLVTCIKKIATAVDDLMMLDANCHFSNQGSGCKNQNSSADS